MNTKSQIQQELEDLGIIIPKSDLPFKEPEQYFDGFAQSVLERIKVEDFLSTLPKEMPYADEHEYLKELSVTPPKRLSTQRSIKWWKPAMAVAASLVIAIGAAVWINKPSPLNVEATIAAIPVDEVQNYLIENANEEDLNLIANNYPDNLPNLNLSEISDEEIQDYIDPYSTDL